MQLIPLAVSVVTAALIAPPAIRALRSVGATRENWGGVEVPFPGGLVAVAAALVALGPLALVDELGPDLLAPGLGRALVFVLGVALLGLVDDLLGERLGRRGEAGKAPRGLRGHGRAALGGGPSTGALKAVGTVGLALYALSGLGLGTARYLLSVGVLVLCTHVFNLLDLRPGRAAKAFVLLGAGLLVGTLDAAPLEALGLLVGPILVLAPYDLRERVMLGDTGSNLVGAVAGLWLVLSLGSTGLAVALGLLAAVTAYGEYRSLGALIERTPVIRGLDSFGRPSHA